MRFSLSTTHKKKIENSIQKTKKPEVNLNDVVIPLTGSNVCQFWCSFLFLFIHLKSNYILEKLKSTIIILCGANHDVRNRIYIQFLVSFISCFIALSCWRAIEKDLFISPYIMVVDDRNSTNEQVNFHILMAFYWARVFFFLWGCLWSHKWLLLVL